MEQWNGRSCADCALCGCKSDGKRPDFCLADSLDREMLEESVRLSSEGEEGRIMRVAASVEHDGYLKWCRVRELVEFSKRMGYRRLGIATCVGMIRETRILTDILRSHGFEVFGIACKAGSVPKTDVGIDPVCCEIGRYMCNPILQAEVLNREHTDLNIIMGLCMGHDCLFNRHSEAPVTTLVVKDRVLAHNPAGALYNADGFYRGLMGDGR